MNRVKLRRRRRALFHEQHGLCWWCKQPMVLEPPIERHRPMPLRMCTVDHLRDRFDPSRRRKAIGDRRLVASCWQCNNDRGNQRQAEQPIEMLRERSQRHPSCDLLGWAIPLGRPA